MDRIVEDLRLVCCKKESLRGAFEQVMLFGIQWEELEEHFDSIAKSMDERLAIGRITEDVRFVRCKKERLRGAFEQVMQVVMSAIGECTKELDLKRRELAQLGISVEDLSAEVRSLESLARCSERYSVEIDEKKVELAKLEKLARRYSEEIELNKGLLASLLQVRTIFITGLPEDVKERELQNLLRWLPGYEASQVNYKDEKPMGFALFSTPQLAIAAEDTSQEMVFDTECLLHTETAKKNLFVKRGIVVDSSAYDQIKRMRTGGDYARTSYVSLSPSNHPPPPVLGTAHNTSGRKLILNTYTGIVVDSSAYDQIKRMRTGGDYARTSYVSLSPSNHPPPPVSGTAHVYDSSFPTSYLGTTLPSLYKP
ncbi:hypothetical protein CRG98_039367 [Punica granatum]|uniref:RRM domain-containing protein n=1 Tax=Punica granatum TaxID=22663 RepID=A0A2I0I8C0_PUNGR|nr:hypothetical protein CRG98_039367 [Punica granatum]